MKTKKCVVRVWGLRHVCYGKNIRIEVPGDVTQDEISLLEPQLLNDVERGPKWQVDDLDNFSSCIEDASFVDFVRSLDDSGHVQARLVRNDRGELVLAD